MYEIDFFPVGTGAKDGDAIALRFDHDGKYVVGVIDGGFTDDGMRVVEHIRHYYGTETVDFVLSTHPDADHIGGLHTVLDELTVKVLLIHQPFNHDFERDPTVDALIQLAQDNGVEVKEPFEGMTGWDGRFLVAGPSQSRYRAEPGEDASALKLAEARSTFAERFLGTAKKTIRKIARAVFPPEDDFDDSGGDASATNARAVVVSLMLDGRHIILPSDAGVPGLNEAMDYLDTQGRTTTYPAAFVLPHHGSRHNFDRDTAERILGSHTSDGRGSAIASVGVESDRPRTRVANAAGRRGYRVFETRGQTLCLSKDAPNRGWTPCQALSPLEEND